jgi:hypothetical protein
MLLNGKSVRGIFVYDDSVKYEKGDLVVIDGRIYQCILESEGENPKTSDKFEIYLGNMISSLDQYYSKDSNYDSLYISSTNLSEILQNEFFGLSDIGVIKEGISYNSDTNSLEFTDGLSNIGSGKKVLDELLNSEINNGLIQVSRSLPEIKDLLLLDTEVDNKYDVVFLRQYTYEYQKKIYRVQELIDFVTARSFFRYSTCDEGSYENPYKFSVSVDDWKGTMTTAEADVQKKLHDIETYYSRRIESLNRELDNLANSYKISTVEFTKEGNSSKYVIDLSKYENKKLGVITLYIKEVGSNNIHRLYETLIDIDSVNEGNKQSYYISESIKVDVFKSSSDAVLVINNDLAEIIEINCKSAYK